MQDETTCDRFGVLLESFIRSCGVYREELQKQVFFFLLINISQSEFIG